MQGLREIFGPAGPLAAALPEFRARRGQRQMAEAVAEAIDERTSLMVEAGTGIGKTFAYLVPALLSGRRCVISTGTRTLQDQLFGRDLPLLSKALGRAQRVVLLKGRSNYLCAQRLERHGAELPLQPGSSLLGKLRAWSQQTRSGDLAEFPELGESHAQRSAFVSTRDNCAGQRCSEFARCHVFAARRAAAEADIVVVNHHLLLADLALKEEGFGDILPSADAIVLDEAHQLPELAAQFFGRSFGSRQVDSLLQDLRAAALACGLGARGFEARERQVIEPLLATGEAIGGGLRPGQRSLWEQAPPRLEEEATRLAQALRGLGDDLEGQQQEPLKPLHERAVALADELDQMLEAQASDGARVIEKTAAGYSLRLLPFDVAERFGALMNARPCAWIFTSATLCVAGDFRHFADPLGIEPETRALELPSPFDYPSQGLLYLPSGLPEPTDPRYPDAVTDCAADLVEASGGGAFLLFTSHRALERAAQRLRGRWLDLDTGELRFNLLVQGESPRERLLQTFRATQDAVLLGTASFWEGVDVKGPALRLVTIDRLPFASPDDPLTRARIEHLRRENRNPFAEFQLPDAAITLKQGVGRLIRGEEDFGLVAICDPRIGSRRYGRQLLASLPAFRVTRSGDEARTWLAALDPAADISAARR
jgi:ATP-dependent DNA helicase DinG